MIYLQRQRVEKYCRTVSYAIPPQNQLVMRKTYLNLLWLSTSQHSGLFLEWLQGVKLWSPQQSLPHNDYCQVLKVQNNWQIVNTNLSRYRSQSLQVLLDNTQGDTSQDSRTYNLRKEEFEICLVRPIERQAQSIEIRVCRILSRPKQQFKPKKGQGFRSTSFSI